MVFGKFHKKVRELYGELLYKGVTTIRAGSEFAYSVTMHCVTFIQMKQIFHRENNDRIIIFYMQAIVNNYNKNIFVKKQNII